MIPFCRTLLAFAVLNCLAVPALAASPACSLLSGEDAARALGGQAAMKDGGAEKDGYSDCAWSGADGAVLSVLFWSSARFADGHASAAEKYELVANDLRRRGTARSALEGLADRGLLVDESSPGFRAAGVVMLKGGQVAQLSARGVSVDAALAAAQAVAARLASTPPDEAVQPRPKPAAVAGMPTETTPEAPPEAPAEVPPAEPPPPVAEPVPGPEPQPAPPQPSAPPPGEPAPEPVPAAIPEPVTPPVAVPEPAAPETEPVPQPVPQPAPEPLPKPPAADPEPVPPAPEPVPPVAEPGPEPPPIRPTEGPERKTGSPACPLLPLKTLEQILPGGTFRMEDRGPAVDGEAECRWSRAGGAVGIALTLLDGVAITSAAENAGDYFDALEGPGPDNGIEALAGVGERAYLQTIGEGDYASYSLSVLAKGRIVFLNLTGTGRDAAIKLGLALAKKM